jgi:hypothetical protein
LPNIPLQEPVKQGKRAMRCTVLASTVCIYINRRIYKGEIPEYLRPYPSGGGKYMLVKIRNPSHVLEFLSKTKGVFSTNLAGLHPGKFYRLLLTGKMPSHSLFTRVDGFAFDKCYQDYLGPNIECSDSEIGSDFSGTDNSFD